MVHRILCELVQPGRCLHLYHLFDHLTSFLLPLHLYPTHPWVSPRKKDCGFDLRMKRTGL